MPATPPARRYRFGVYEADQATGELRRQGMRIKLNAQPCQVLFLFLDRPGELLTREDISRHLWPDGTFVDYEHGVNSAVNRLRGALRDTAKNPRFIETLSRRGYRFVAPVERLEGPVGSEPKPATAAPPPEEILEEDVFSSVLATRDDLPKTSPTVVRALFVGLQLMYVGFYVGALANLAEIGDLMSPLSFAVEAMIALVVTAALLIPVRAFVVSAVMFQAPGARGKILKLWPFLLLADVLWSLSPFLLLHHISFGLALACTALLVYSPFAQRSLVLMGAGAAEPVTPRASG